MPPFGEVEKDIEGQESDVNYVLVTLFAIAIVLAFLADLITVNILRRFKRLKTQHHNAYIFHAAILNIINVIFMAVNLVLETYRISRNAEVSSFYKLMAHMSVDTMISLLFAEFSLMTLMTIDWYIFTFIPSKSAILRKYKNAVIIATYTYIITVFLYSIVVTLLYGAAGMLSVILFPLNVLLSFIMYIILEIIYFCRRKTLAKSNVILLNISLLKVSPWICLKLFLVFGLVSIGKFLIFHFIAVFFFLVAISSPMLQLIVLYFWDRNYKAALSKIFDCGKTDEAEDIENIEDSREEGGVLYSTNNGEITHVVN